MALKVAERSRSSPVGGEVGDRVATVRQAQAGAHQAVEGLLELAVGHARAPEGDAPHIRIRVLNCRPSRACMPYAMSCLRRSCLQAASRYSAHSIKVPNC